MSKRDIKTVLSLLFIGIVVCVVIAWQYFYWTNCAFTEAAKAPAICFVSR